MSTTFWHGPLPYQYAIGPILGAQDDTVEITPEGHVEKIRWRRVAGATGVRLADATIRVVPETAGPGRAVTAVSPARQTVTGISLSLGDQAGAPLRAVRIPDLRRHDVEAVYPITTEQDLAGDLHLVLARKGAQEAPLVAVPPLPRRGELPQQLVGGSLSGSLFRVPDVPGTEFEITLVAGNSPEEFVRQIVSHGDVRPLVAPMPVGLHVDGPDDAEIFTLAGPVTSTLEVDLRATLKRHLDAAVTGDADPLATIRVRSDGAGRAKIQLSVGGGVIERRIEGRLTSEVSGSPTAIPLPAPHPGRAAERTVADVTVTHHGVAIHPISDPIPDHDADLAGVTVREEPVVRALPPEALRGSRIARVGVIGWPRAETDLTLSVLGVTATATGLPAPADRQPPSVVWFTLPEPVTVDRQIEISLVAGRGAFGWVAEPEPLVRVAVVTEPAGAQVSVSGQRLTLTGVETTAVGLPLPGTDGWTVQTDHFCTVALTNTVMEFTP